jgi:UDP-N-acetylmuramoyl-L-alanyl-D-glutamate--2,6-diaminopimelate ligase
MKHMRLESLIGGLNILDTRGETALDIRRPVFDSREAGPGDLFIAVRGVQTDGHIFLERALDSGAAAVVVETLPESLRPGVTYLQVPDSAQALGLIACAFHGNPSASLKLVGVTGTNGKTTTVTLLYQLFTALGYRCGLISTVENRIHTQILPSAYTTPDALGLNALLANMVAAGCDYVFMEVSSHAIDQRRIAGLHFAGAIFTNITHDHLDYHKTFDQYLKAKKAFFDVLDRTSFALVNADDKRGMVMVQNTRARIYRYSLQQMADFKGRVISNTLPGLHLDINGKEVHTRLIGDFNAYNLLAAFGAACLLGQDSTEALICLSKVEAAEGRFDYLVDHRSQITAIVDYAHTPDALEKVLRTLKALKKGAGSVITVFGCGGDRDRSKRPEMARVACALSDQVIITSDNPRSEDPEEIIREIEAGVSAADKPRVIAIPDRKTAIRTACKIAKTGDMVLVAGKGHEKYQEIKGVKYPFDDKEALKAALSLN